MNDNTTYKILILDDETGITNLLKDYFNILGTETIIYHTLEEAIKNNDKLKKENNIILALIDKNIDSYENKTVQDYVKLIKKDYEFTILTMTGETEKIPETDGLLTKPFTITILEEIIEQEKNNYQRRNTKKNDQGNPSYENPNAS